MFQLSSYVACDGDFVGVVVWSLITAGGVVGREGVPFAPDDTAADDRWVNASVADGTCSLCRYFVTSGDVRRGALAGARSSQTFVTRTTVPEAVAVKV